MCGAVQKENRCGLIIKIIHGNICQFFAFAALRYFSMTTNQAVRLATPFVAVTLAYVLLGEATNMKNCLVIILTVTAVSFVVVGEHSLVMEATEEAPVTDDGEQSFEYSPLFVWYCYFALVMVPVGIATGQVILRSIRGLPEMTVTSYANFTQFFVMLGLVPLFGGDLSFFKQFTPWIWFCMFCAASFLVFAQVFKFKATQSLPVSVLQPISYSEMVFSFLSDILIFHTDFNTMQLGGIIAIFVLCLV